MFLTFLLLYYCFYQLYTQFPLHSIVTDLLQMLYYYHNVYCITYFIFQSHYCQQGYILTQFPLRSTVIDLWQMLYDYQSNTVVIADVLHFDEQVFLYISVIFIILCAKILSRVENIVHDMLK